MDPGLASRLQRSTLALLAGLVLGAGLATAGCSKGAPESTPDNGDRLDTYLAGPRRSGARAGVYLGAGEVELGFMGYLAPARDPRVALVYFHGIESHAGWFDTAANLLQERGFDVFCLDRRGSGINRENRGLPSGHADSMDVLFTDIDAFVRPLATRYRRVVLIGLSWGGKLATAWSLRRPGAAAGLVLITPGIRALVDVPLSTKLRILAASFVAPMSRFPTPIEPEMFTATPRHLEFIRKDPLRLTEATASFFMTSLALDRFVDRHIRDNRPPILLLLAGRDRIIDNEGVVRVLEQGAATDLEIVDYPDQTHSIQFDAPARMVGDILRWLEQRIPGNEDTTSA